MLRLAAANDNEAGQFRFWCNDTAGFSIKGAEGWLGGANTSKRDRAAHEAVSYGSGDDAGHLIARRFGGPDTAANFGKQNWIQNRGGGTYFKTETMLWDALKAGSRVHLKVEEKTYKGTDEKAGRSGDRAFYRMMQWLIIDKANQRSGGSVAFLNSESQRMRDAMGIEVKQYDSMAKVYQMDDYR